jgi:hypothetical protein
MFKLLLPSLSIAISFVVMSAFAAYSGRSQKGVDTTPSTKMTTGTRRHSFRNDTQQR